MKCPEISKAIKEMNRLKEVYCRHQIYIDNLKSSYWDPYEHIDRDVWEKVLQETIKFEGQLLRKYETAIRELRKRIKKLNREQNDSRKH